MQYDALKPFDTILNCSERQRWLAIVDDFRKANWLEVVRYPELVYQKSVKLLEENGYAYA